MTEILTTMFRRAFGYFRRDRDTGQGPTVLGMETSEHKEVPKAEEINKAINELKEMYPKKTKKTP